MTIRFLTLLSVLLPATAVLAQENVCIECHGGQPGRLGAPVEAWRGSIHAANGIFCHGCHGGDPTDFAMAMSPERGFVGVPDDWDVPDFCGRCHVGVREDYLQSAHGQTLEAGGPQCVTCHGNHAVQKATIELINPQDCSRCHEYGRAEEIKGAVAETDRLISGLEGRLDALYRVGIDTEAMKGQVFALRNRFHRLFHTVEVDTVHRETAGFQRELGEVGQQVTDIEGKLGRRKVWGGGAVALLVLAGVLFMLLRRTYEEEE